MSRGKRITDWLRLVDVPMYYYRRTGDSVPAIITVRSWIVSGKAGYANQKVRLRVKERHVGSGGRYLTRKVWVDEFIAGLFGVQHEEVQSK